jgi:hypothetical protein
MEADKDGDGKISFEEFCQMVASTVCPAMKSLTEGCGGEYDLGRRVVLFKRASCISVYPCGLAFGSIIACHVRIRNETMYIQYSNKPKVHVYTLKLFTPRVVQFPASPFPASFIAVTIIICSSPSNFLNFSFAIRNISFSRFLHASITPQIPMLVGTSG